MVNHRRMSNGCTRKGGRDMSRDNWGTDRVLDQTLESVTDWQKLVTMSAGWAGPGWAQSVAAFNAEVVRFLSDRLDEDLKTQAEILQCRDPVSLREIQGRFLKTAFEQYCAEIGKLVQMNQAAVSQVCARESGG